MTTTNKGTANAQIYNTIYQKIVSICENCNKIIIIKPEYISQAKEILFYFPLIFEVYCILFHSLIVKLWFLSNFILTWLHIYDSLSDSDVNNETKSIKKNYIKKTAVGVIGFGFFLLLVFTSVVGITSVPLMLYTMFRTYNNIFSTKISTSQ